MAEPKTKVNDASVADFLNAIPNAQVREDCWTIADIMQTATNDKPRMWGTNIVGFGQSRTVYANGKEADWMLIAFAPRKQNITLYLMAGFEGRDELLAKLGKHSCGKGCLYIKRLSDVHLPTLKELVRASVQHKKKALDDGVEIHGETRDLELAGEQEAPGSRFIQRNEQDA